MISKYDEAKIQIVTGLLGSEFVNYEERVNEDVGRIAFHIHGSCSSKLMKKFSEVPELSMYFSGKELVLF